jgi:hypothetical protein
MTDQQYSTPQNYQQQPPPGWQQYPPQQPQPNWQPPQHQAPKKKHRLRNGLVVSGVIVVVAIIAAALGSGGGKTPGHPAAPASTPAAAASSPSAPTTQQQLITKLEATTASDGNTLYADLQSAGINPVTLANQLCAQSSGSVSVPSAWTTADDQSFDNAVTSTMCPGVTVRPLYTASEQAAIQDAQNYLQTEPGFSKTGLIKQLEYDKYSYADARFAVNHISVNWMQQAADDARNYQQTEGGFSYGGMVQQLEYDGFTPAQAAHGAQSIGL